MHESGVIEELLGKVESAAKANAAKKVVTVEVSLGPLAGIEAEHLRQHFVIAAVGTLAEGAELRVRETEQPGGGILLESVEIET
jgi:hydrogenase nickel incorporation protein HypA/HybF